VREIDIDAIADEQRIASLIKDVEALALHPPLFGNTAITPWGNPYLVVVNGSEGMEGIPAVKAKMSIGEACNESIKTVRSLREKIDGDAILIWRCLPRLSDGHVYLRFRFEPLHA
jgi:hypothetical protein